MQSDMSRNYDFAFMSHWLTDVIGHKGDLAEASALLSIFETARLRDITTHAAAQEVAEQNLAEAATTA